MNVTPEQLAIANKYSMNPRQYANAREEERRMGRRLTEKETMAIKDRVNTADNASSLTELISRYLEQGRRGNRRAVK